MANILVTGGAGYVGAHVCKALQRGGHVPVSFDNLSAGNPEALRFGPGLEGDLRDPAALAAAFAHYQPLAVMHLAALSDVAASMKAPETYHEVNVTGTANLLEAMAAAGCRHIVLSSTCAIYADIAGGNLDEESPTGPASVYGTTKIGSETLLRKHQAAGRSNHVILRYFNVAGADPEGEVGEFHRPETHLVPIALKAAVTGTRVAINGDDYATPDGTCVRDYIHVSDIARAHLLSLDMLLAGSGSETINLGSGRGYSVREVLESAGKVTGRPVSAAIGPRRPGDSARLVSGSDKALRLLRWQPERSALDTMIGDAWAWHRTAGFAD